MRHWWQRYPARLESELASLDEAGFSYVLEEDAKRTGRIVVHVEYADENYACTIVVAYPVTYPRTIFSAYSKGFVDGRHKEHNQGKLCLYHDEHNAWNGECVGVVLKDQIPKIFAVHTDAKNAGDFETDAGVQITGQLSYQQNSVILQGEHQIPEEYNRGFLDLGILVSSDPNTCFRGVLVALEDDKRNPLLNVTGNLNKLITGRLRGRWIRLDKQPANFEAGVLNEAISLWPTLMNPVFNKGPDVTGLLFPVEVRKGETEYHWLFVVRYKVQSKTPGSKHIENRIQIANIRPDVMSPETMMARVPALHPLATKKITMIGLGALGSAIAWQLARAGVGEIRLVDFDHVTSGNAPRWIAGVIAAGINKVDWIGSQIASNYPACEITGETYTIGAVYADAPIENEYSLLGRIFDGADLIIDATAELAVTSFINDYALSMGIPMVWATGTAGAYGGVAGRISGDWRQSCWGCYQREIAQATPSIDLPPAEDGAEESVQTIGCFHPTFTGTGFDMDHVSLMATRLAIATLCRGQEGAYPDFDWDVAVLSLRDDEGNPIPSKWKTHQLAKHPECDEH